MPLGRWERVWIKRVRRKTTEVTTGVDETMDPIRTIARVWGRELVEVGEPAPLVGHIAFGVIDRGTNVLQVRPSTLCPHNCVYCSVDAGPRSRTRQREFLVDASYLVEWVEAVARAKGVGVEALIDGVGEPLTHPRIVEIVEVLASSEWVERVAVETHGGFLSRKLIDLLDNAGLSRINLSLDTLDPAKARMLAGVDWYRVDRVVGVAEYALRETGIDVVLTPVVVPGVNEEDMKDLIEWARLHEAGVKSGWPTGVLIQKMEVHRYGRVPRGVKPWSWKRFYKWLRRLEEETGYRLLVSPEEIGIVKAPRLDEPYRQGDTLVLEVLGPGWHKGERLAVDREWTRIFALYCRRPCEARRVRARIARSKDNIYVAVH